MRHSQDIETLYLFFILLPLADLYLLDTAELLCQVAEIINEY